MSASAITCECGGDSMVMDSRESPTGQRRRRQCLACGQRWTTQEVRAEEAPEPLREKIARASKVLADLAAELAAP